MIGCSPMMSHIHVHVLHKLRIKAWVDKESWWSASWYQQSRIGVVWFCQLETNPVTLNLFIYHHGTGPWSPAEFSSNLEKKTSPACSPRLFLNSKNAENGLVFSWRPVLQGFLERANSEGRENTEQHPCENWDVLRSCLTDRIVSA